MLVGFFSMFLVTNLRIVLFSAFFFRFVFASLSLCIAHFIFVIFLSNRAPLAHGEKWREIDIFSKTRKKRRTLALALAHQQYRVRDATERKETTKFLASLVSRCVRACTCDTRVSVCRYFYTEFFVLSRSRFFFSRQFYVD